MAKGAAYNSSMALGFPSEGSTLMSRKTSSSMADAPSHPRVILPSDLSGSIKYLDDRELQRLFEAVNAEIARRDLIDPGDRRAGAAGSTPSLTADLSATLGKEKTKRDDEIPAGKVSLIRASFESGMKPAAIARALRVSQSSVRGVLSSAARASNPKRRT